MKQLDVAIVGAGFGGLCAAIKLRSSGVDSLVILPVQVNGKRRGEISVAPGAAHDLIEKEALSLDAVARMLDGKPPRKVIVVQDRIVNVVV